MPRIAVLVISVIVALSMATPIALVGAQGPPEDVEYTVKLSDFGPLLCAFDVLFEVSGKAGVIALPGGGFILTSPALRATLTNLTSGESVTLSITGAFHNTTLENGNVQTVYTGRNILGDPLEGLVLLIGEFTGVADRDTGRLVQPLEGNGQQIDLCALLS
jgi:hypothetical protein